jgi:hypothetical protein
VKLSFLFEKSKRFSIQELFDLFAVDKIKMPVLPKSDFDSWFVPFLAVTFISLSTG